MNVKFHKNCENTGKILKFHVQDIILWNLMVIFLGSHKKFSLVLLQMTTYIFSPWKILKRMKYALNIIVVQGFCPLKIQIIQFPRGRNRR